MADETKPDDVVTTGQPEAPAGATEPAAQPTTQPDEIDGLLSEYDRTAGRAPEASSAADDPNVDRLLDAPDPNETLTAIYERDARALEQSWEQQEAAQAQARATDALRLQNEI